MFGNGERVTSKRFYNTYKMLQAEIEVDEHELNRLRRERARYIDKSGPAAVRAVRYDKGPKSTVFTPDEQILEEIRRLTAKIQILEENLREKREQLMKIKETIKRLSDETTNVEYKVFVASFIEGKPNKEVANELDYAVKTVKNVKTGIYQKIELR